MPSAIKPKPKSKRGRPSQESQRVLYQIKIHGWDMSWSFGLASSYYSRADEGSYSEYLILTLRGKVMYPEGLNTLTSNASFQQIRGCHKTLHRPQASAL